MAGAGLCQCELGSGLMTAVRASAADVLKGAKAIFELRKKMVNDPDPAHRHPMLYKEYGWEALPASERIYYCDMSIANFTSFGVTCEPVTIAQRVA